MRTSIWGRPLTETDFMEVLIKSPNARIRDAAEIQLYEKFEKLGHLMPGILFCDVVLTRAHHTPQTYHVHAKLSIPGDDLFAEESGNSYLHASRLVIADLENQIRKIREKRNRHAADQPDTIGDQL